MLTGMSDAAEKLPEAKDPTGLDGVRSHLAGLLADGRHEDVLEQVMALLAKLLLDNTDKSHRIAALLKQLYGRKSERMSSGQLELFLQALADEGEETLPPEPASEAKPETKPVRPQQRRPGRNPLPEHLPEHRQPDGHSGRSVNCRGLAA